MLALMLLQTILQKYPDVIKAHVLPLLDSLMAILTHFVESAFALVSPDEETMSVLLHCWQCVARILEVVRGGRAVRGPHPGGGEGGEGRAGARG